MMEVDGGEIIVAKKKGVLSFFKKMVWQNERKKKNALYSKEADNFLNAQYYDHFLHLMLAGYNPNKSQMKKWDNHVELLINNLKFNKLNEYLEKGLPFTEKIFHLCFKNDKFMSAVLSGRLKSLDRYTNKNIKKIEFTSDVCLLNKVRDVLNSDKFHMFFKDYWIKKVKDACKTYKAMNSEFYLSFHKYDYSVSTTNGLINQTLGMSDILLNGMKYEEFMEKVKHWNNLVNEVEDGLKCGLGNKDKPQDLIDLVKKSSKAINDYLEVVGKESAVIKSIDFKKVDYSDLKKPELPQNLIDVLTSIEEKYSILKAKDNLYLSIDIERTIEEQVPKIVNKYLSMDNKYKKTLVIDEGLSALDLTVDSLLNIEKKLDEKILLINEEHLHNINALNRYTKLI